MTNVTFPARDALARRKVEALSDWDVEGLPAMFGTGTQITIRTQQVIIERNTPAARILSNLHKVALVGSTLAIMASIGITVFYSINMLDNLHVVAVMQAQSVHAAVTGK